MTKFEFVKKLCEFYQLTEPDCGIVRMDYVLYDSADFEMVYVTFSSHSQKRFNVTGDSNKGILYDFIRFMRHFDDYPWLMPDQQREFK